MFLDWLTFFTNYDLQMCFAFVDRLVYLQVILSKNEVDDVEG